MVSTKTWSVIRLVARRVLLGEEPAPPAPPPPPKAPRPPLPVTPVSSYRGRLLAVHGALATVAVIAFVSQSSARSLSGAGTGSGGMTLVALAFPALIPYIMSILSSHAWVNKPRRNVTAFLVVLGGGGVAAGLLTVDAFGWHFGALALLGVYLAQTALYMGAVGGLLMNSPETRSPI